MSETSIVAIILGLVAVGGTLLGTWVGRIMERSNETRKWRRDRCYEAYIEVFKTCHIVSFEANNIYGIGCGTIQYVKQQEIVLTKVAEIYNAVDKTVLLGSKKAHEKFRDLTNFYGMEVAAKPFKCPKI